MVYNSKRLEEAGLLIKGREIYKPMKRKDNNLEQFEKALDNGNYFSWDFSTKLYACQAYAQEITNLSLRSKLSREQIIENTIVESIELNEFEFVQMIKDVEVFFKTKSWIHLDGK